ncbi:MAG: ATPase, T2SS/T4P/T4SS family [Candidatus Diapherotrites archaeon]|nr:ATPase, T2SS/T4P/T4SS family [Candidatus Diapherotrites archaeon]
MKQKSEYSVFEIDYSKKLSECQSGEIVSRKDEKYLIAKVPILVEKEQKLFLKVLEEMKHSEKVINTKGDVYFFLKEYCLENMVLVNKEQREKLLTLLEWEATSESILTPLLAEPEFEEIVINGPKKPVMVYHETFGWLKTNICFETEDKIRTIINKMASTLGRQLSYHTPMINAVLKDGSRLNASMNPVAFSGINATIRKFKDNPLTPADLVKLETINKEAMAYLWLVMQTSCSILICGNTGSGKTTTLNALFCFLPKNERIIIVEETPELSLPQTHSIKLNTAEQLDITLGALIDNTFRMRPDRVIVGEIRSKNEAIAFVNTMLAGQAKGSYATFHAESAIEALERLRSFGIEESALASIDLIVVQKRIGIIESGNRREIRKVVEIGEIVKEKQETGGDYESKGKQRVNKNLNSKHNKRNKQSWTNKQNRNNIQNGGSKIVGIRRLYGFNHSKKELIKENDGQRTMEKILTTFNLGKKEIETILLNREKILQNMQGTADFYEFFEAAEKETV